jgi:hypothetical protein
MQVPSARTAAAPAASTALPVVADSGVTLGGGWPGETGNHRALAAGSRRPESARRHGSNVPTGTLAPASCGRLRRIAVHAAADRAPCVPLLTAVPARVTARVLAMRRHRWPCDWTGTCHSAIPSCSPDGPIAGGSGRIDRGRRVVAPGPASIAVIPTREPVATGSDPRWTPRGHLWRSRSSAVNAVTDNLFGQNRRGLA